MHRPRRDARRSLTPTGSACRHPECPPHFVDNRQFPNDEGLDVGYNGYALIDFEGPSLRVEYKDITGEVVHSERWAVDRDRRPDAVGPVAPSPLAPQIPAPCTDCTLHFSTSGTASRKSPRPSPRRTSTAATSTARCADGARRPCASPRRSVTSAIGTIDRREQDVRDQDREIDARMGPWPGRASIRRARDRRDRRSGTGRRRERRDHARAVLADALPLMKYVPGGSRQPEVAFSAAFSAGRSWIVTRA